MEEEQNVTKSIRSMYLKEVIGHANELTSHMVRVRTLKVAKQFRFLIFGKQVHNDFKDDISMVPIQRLLC